MIYEFICGNCEHEFEIIRKVCDRHNAEPCPSCLQPAYKRELPSSIRLQTSELADWNSGEHYNPALGVKVKNNLEAKKIAKAKGLTEVGNEDPGKLAAKFEAERKKKAEFDIKEITGLGEVKSKPKKTRKKTKARS